jgi:plasmid stabilization system protein ParE
MRLFTVILSERAKREIAAARRWQTEQIGAHRAADMDDELAAALERLEALPEMGPRVQVRKKPSATFRRVILGRCGYHVYYRVYRDVWEIDVVCFWHGRRRSPRLG